MQLVRKIIAAYLVIVGLAVFLNLIATPLYHDGSDDYQIWKILNWFMAVAVLIVLVVGWPAKARPRQHGRRERDRSLARELRLLRRHRPHHAVLLGVVLDAEPQQRDGRSGHVAHDLLPGGRLAVDGPGAHRRTPDVERG